ncbi:MAG: hypothetical protein LBK70_02225 [Clostridiales bacterium]|jgi:hypothetical protein|nr:hypothetical protein [Clostridiales bacterium]
MTCPGCNNEVKGNFCPTCKKPVSLGGGLGAAKKPAASAGAPSAAAHLNRSAAMDQKGTGPKAKDKTIDGYDKSNAVQAKYSSHLIAKDKASDFGNMTRSNRWKLAENIAMALLLLASIIGIVALMLPFFSGLMASSGDIEDVTGLSSIGFDFKDSGGAIIGTMSMLSMIAFALVAVLAILKLLASIVPALGFVNQTPVAIAHAVLAILGMVFAILVFTSVSAFIAKGSIANLINFEGNSGVGTLLLLIAGISAVVVGLAGALTRLKLNTLNQAIKGGKSASGAMM